jgi:hypothetical protein
MMGVRFGFLSEPTSLVWSGGSIEPLPDHADVVQGILAHQQHYAGWLYPPLRGVRRDSSELKESPKVPATFALPSTHLLTLADGNAEPAAEDFFIALFGMLKGLRLQRDGWQHFFKCPTKRGALSDFCADDREIATTLDLAAEFWQRHTDTSTRKLAFGAIHWHLFAQLYEHEFERFNAQYTALDACWALSRKALALPKVTHAERPAVLARALGLLTPSWALTGPQEQSACSLSLRRNALVHEAMYADEPLGFAHPATERGMALELQNFVARCIFALLGVRNEYTRSPGDTRQVFGFDFDWLEAGDD